MTDENVEAELAAIRDELDELHEQVEKLQRFRAAIENWVTTWAPRLAEFSLDDAE